MYNDDLPWLVRPAKAHEDEGDVYEQALTAIYQAMKFHNPTDLLGIIPHDLKDLAINLKAEYSPTTVELAKQQTLKGYTGKALTIGVFLEKCMANNRLEESLKETQSLIQRNDKPHKSDAEQNLMRIRGALKTITDRPLPYDKNVRVGREARSFSHEADPSPKGTPLKREDEITFAPMWGYASYSDGPRLYEKCVAVRHIAPAESIKNAELRDLYIKAWSVGLMREEKSRFNELMDHH